MSVSQSLVEWDNREDVLQELGWEYYEPWSWLSVFSAAGTNWVCETSQCRNFVGMAERFASDLMQQTTGDMGLGVSVSFAEPNEATIWEYVDGEIRTLPIPYVVMAKSILL